MRLIDELVEDVVWIKVALQTCNPASISYSHCAKTIIRDGCYLPRTTGSMVVVTEAIRVRHGIGIIGVKVVASFRALYKIH